MQQILEQLADSVVSARTLEDLTRPLLELLEAVTGLESTYLTSIDVQRGVQHILYARNSQQLQIPEGLSVPWSDTLCKRALEEGRAHTDDVAGCWGDSGAARALGITTYVSNPVHVGDSVYGTLCAASARRLPLTPGAHKILLMFARLIGQHIERERLLTDLQAANSELSSRALSDPVTGLANRRALHEEGARMLARARRTDAAVVVAFLDLNGFKSINDCHGHDFGDKFLRAVADRIRISRRATDLVARVGGDEFVVVAPVSRDSLEASAQAIRTGLAKCVKGRYRLEGIKIDYVGASVGIATGSGDETSLDELVKRADAAMYVDKRMSKDSASGR